MLLTLKLSEAPKCRITLLVHERILIPGCNGVEEKTHAVIVPESFSDLPKRIQVALPSQTLLGPSVWLSVTGNPNEGRTINQRQTYFPVFAIRRPNQAQSELNGDLAIARDLGSARIETRTQSVLWNPENGQAFTGTLVEMTIEQCNNELRRVPEKGCTTHITLCQRPRNKVLLVP